MITNDFDVTVKDLKKSNAIFLEQEFGLSFMLTKRPQAYDRWLHATVGNDETMLLHVGDQIGFEHFRPAMSMGSLVVCRVEFSQFFMEDGALAFIFNISQFIDVIPEA